MDWTPHFCLFDISHCVSFFVLFIYHFGCNYLVLSFFLLILVTLSKSIFHLLIIHNFYLMFIFVLLDDQKYTFPW